MLRKLWAFYKRDWQIAATNRFRIFHMFGSVIASLAGLYFVGKLLRAGGENPYLKAYGGDYFRFVLLGIITSGLMGTALRSFTQMIHSERGHGTLEMILLTPTSLTAMALGKTLWDLTRVVIRVAVLLLLGSLLFHADFSKANWLALILAGTLTAGIFLGIGMITAGLSLLWRESAPFETLFHGISQFLAGVYFPVEIIPSWLQTASHLLPLTHSLRLIRRTLIEGISLSAVGKELAILSGFFLVCLPLGFLFFRWALTEARRQGSLGFK